MREAERELIKSSQEAMKDPKWKELERNLGLSVFCIVHSRGGANHHRLRGCWVPHPQFVMQFSCHAHFKILLEVTHPNPKRFSSNLAKLGIDLGKKWERQVVYSPPVTPPLVHSNFSMLWDTCYIH